MVVRPVLFILLALVHALTSFVFFKQKTSYEMRISDWSSDVCSSDLASLGNYLRAIFTALLAIVLLGEAFRTFHAVAFVLVILGVYLMTRGRTQIGRAACRERVCQYVSISVVAASLNKKNRD